MTRLGRPSRFRHRPARALRLLLWPLLWLPGLVGAKPPSPEESAPPAAASRPLSESRKTKIQNELRTRSPEQRGALLAELGAYTDVAAARLLIQFGLRDRLPRLQATAATALAQTRGFPPIDRLLIETLRQEVRSSRRPWPDFVVRLADAVAQRRSLATTTELLQLADGADAGLSELAVDALLRGIDGVAADADASALPMLATVTQSPPFDRVGGLRKSVLDALRRIAEPAAVGLVIRCLPRVDGELRWDATQHLERVTRQKFGTDSAAWQRWWEREGPTYRWPTAEPPAQPRPDEAAGSPLYYYDLPIRAERVVFVLDVSKSMGLGRMESRLAAAQRELSRTIEKLPDATLFNVIVFQATVTKWQERLHPATPATRAHAVAFVRSQRPQGKTATCDALQAALGLSPEPEAIYLLSDGVPSEGEIVVPERVLEVIRRQNHRQRTRIYTLGTLAGPQDAGLAEFLEKLAAQNFGQFRRLD